MSKFLKSLCKIAIPVTLQSMLQSSFSIVDQIDVYKRQALGFLGAVGGGLGVSVGFLRGLQSGKLGNGGIIGRLGLRLSLIHI